MSSPTLSRDVHFAAGLPGFPGVRDFRLEPVDAHGPYLRLSSLEGAVSFTAALPGVFFPDYAVALDELHRERLGLTEASDALLLVLLSGRPDGSVTANLLGPVVVNLATGAAAQIVLDGQPADAHAVPLPA